ncbi:MAG TPA: hypothetical protein VF843_05290 [Streptosporangiaceae bacterium]
MAGTQYGPGQAQPGYGPAPVQPGFGGPPPQPRRRRALIIVGAVAVLVVVGIIGGLVAASHPKGGVSLPGKLLGLSKATSADARRLATTLKSEESSGGKGRLKNVQAAVYGSPSGTGIAVSGGGICGTCEAKSPAVVRGNLTSSGYAGATSFPGGSKGGTVACGTKGGLIRCTWVDKGTAGDILFAGSSASGLADAAAKTNQIRTVIEH